MSAVVLKSLPREFAGQIRTASDWAQSRSHVSRAPGRAVGSAEIDRLLQGGLRRGETTEVVGRASSGRFSLVLQAAAARTASGETVAFVDLGDGLDPRSAESFGIDLRRLLWVRPRTVREALASAEAILQTAIPLLIVDLGPGPLPGGKGRISEAAWRRLVRGVEEHGVTVLVSSPYRVTGSAAHTVLEAGRGHGRWHVESPSQQRRRSPSVAQAPALLRGLEANFELTRDRENRRAAPARLGLRVETAELLDPLLDPLLDSSQEFGDVSTTSTVRATPTCEEASRPQGPADVVPFPTRPARRGRDSRRGRRYTALLQPFTET